MSTSSSPARNSAVERSILPFGYVEASSNAAARSNSDRSATATSDSAGREAAARKLGHQEGTAEAEARLAEELSRTREAVGVALRSFALERQTFYENVEEEVVNLALSIARKILHREAQIDPRLLAGMVKVALEAIEARTGVVVHVSPESVSTWRDYFGEALDPQSQPEVVADATLEPERCVIETLLGKTEVGLDVQLKEIEQGLLDLLAQRPR